MVRLIYSGTALTTVMLLALPFLSSQTPSIQALLEGPADRAEVVVAADDRDASIDFLIAAAEDRAREESSTNESDSASSSTDAPEATQPGDAGSSSGTPSASGGGTTGGTSPAPAPPAPPAPEPPPPACPSAIGGSTPGAPSATSPLGVAGTTSGDLQSFAERYNAIRVANCLPPVPFGNIRYDSCMEQRLFWMAEDPSTDPMSAWGHIGSERSDGVPSVGCDGNLAGGSGNTGATVAQKWWDSSSHRSSLYKPSVTGSMANVCIVFAMTHGGIPNEPYSFTRAAARWVNC